MMRHRNHVTSDDAWTDGLLHIADGVEHGEHFACHVVQCIARFELWRIVDQAAEQCEAVRLIERGVILLDAEVGEDVGNGIGMHVGFLTDVEPREVEAEGARETDQIEQVGIGRVAVAVTDQRIAHQLEVAQELTFVFVTLADGVVRPAFHARDAALLALVQTQADDIEFAPIGFLGEPRGPVGIVQGTILVVGLQAGEEGR